MNKPILVERYADNGAFSHWALIQEETGELLWSEAPGEETQQVKNCSIPDVVLSEERTELPEVGCINSLGCACKQANGYPLTDCTYWQGN